jgi:hypothetical protein
MTGRWEYLMVVWTYEAIMLPRSAPNAKLKWRFKRDFYIWRPGAAESDHRPVYDSEDKEVSGPNGLEILNELGAEGWELAGETISESIVGKRFGWPEAGHPVRREWTLKRTAESAAS